MVASKTAAISGTGMLQSYVSEDAVKMPGRAIEYINIFVR